MNKEEVQAIVFMTIKELKRQGMLKDRYSVILKETEPIIKQFFLKKNNKELERLLIEYSDDPYIDVIYLHYRDGLTIEKIAEVMDKDASTIKRNKKRLIQAIYNTLEI